MPKISEYDNGDPPNNSDEYVVARSGKNKKLTWLNLRNALETYFDTLYLGITGGIAVDGWISYSAVTPTRSSADDPTYVITFAGVDLTGLISVGMRLKWTQDGTVRYGIVTAIAYSTNTAITLYGGTDYDVDDTASFAISDFYYSPVKAPLGFPLDPTKWEVSTVDTTSRSQSSPTATTWYNPGSVSLTVPIGAWHLSWSGYCYVIHNSTTATGVFATLSTANNSESDAKMTISAVNFGASGNLRAYVSGYKSKMIKISSKTSYYANVKTDYAGTSTVGFLNASIPTVITARCAYL